MANKYELLYIIDAAAEEKAREDLIEKVKSMVVKSGGTIESLEKIGFKKLAYPINYKTDGFYVLMNIACEPSVPGDMEQKLLITDNFVRCLFIRK